MATGEFRTPEASRGAAVERAIGRGFSISQIYLSLKYFLFKPGAEQRGHFRLLSNRLVLGGPSFKQPMDTSIDATTGQVAVRYTDDDGKEKSISRQLDLPNDVANGMLFTVAKHIQPGVRETTVSYVAATPEPRVVTLVVARQGEVPITHGTIKNKAIRYAVKTKIGGVAGMVAPLIGKQPPDTQLWVLGGKAPAFIKSEGPLYQGGPIWRVELSAPARFS
jgi:hypothetical protein